MSVNGAGRFKGKGAMSSRLHQRSDSMDEKVEALAAIIRGGIRVMGRRICPDKECDCKHPGWTDCVMFRRWVELAEAKLKELGLEK